MNWKSNTIKVDSEWRLAKSAAIHAKLSHDAHTLDDLIELATNRFLCKFVNKCPRIDIPLGTSA